MRSLVQTDAAKPYSLSFAAASTASASSNGNTQVTGPKISSCTSRLSLERPVKITRPEEQALAQPRIVWEPRAGAAGGARSAHPLLDEGPHLIELAFADDRADIRLLVQRIAHPHRVDTGGERVHEAIVDRALDIDAARRRAALALAGEAHQVIAPATVLSKSQSANTTIGLLPPSSSVTGISFSAAARATMRPTSTRR